MVQVSMEPLISCHDAGDVETTCTAEHASNKQPEFMQLSKKIFFARSLLKTKMVVFRQVELPEAQEQALTEF